MKWLIVCCLGIGVFFTGDTSAPVRGSKLMPVISDTPVLSFKIVIEPILVKRCSPCHFTGGAMYGRMPFDRDTTIIRHSSGVLKRIKDADEKSILQLFLEQNKGN